jgi:predicted nuclease with TOPRIM domain
VSLGQNDNYLILEFAKLRDENARLKAEVERLQNNCDYLDRELDREIDKTAMLCGQVERLRKAGDAVALDYAERIEIEAGETAKTLMKTVPVLRDWNAAKEGKPAE